MLAITWLQTYACVLKPWRGSLYESTSVLLLVFLFLIVTCGHKCSSRTELIFHIDTEACVFLHISQCVPNRQLRRFLPCELNPEHCTLRCPCTLTDRGWATGGEPPTGSVSFHMPLSSIQEKLACLWSHSWREPLMCLPCSSSYTDMFCCHLPGPRLRWKELCWKWRVRGRFVSLRKKEEW